MTPLRVSWRTASAAVLSAAALVTTGSLASPAGADANGFTCIAHRGNPSGHTEETMPVYNAIMATGVAAIDGDVRFSSTGYPYMLHNADMGLFGHPSVNLADISGTTAASYVSSTGDTIASLYQVAQAVLANPGIKLEVELKTVPTAAQWTTLHSRLDPIQSVTTVTSFNLATVRAAQDNGFRTAYLVEAPVTTTAAPTVDQESSSITAGEVSELAGVGVQVEAWTPNTVADWNALASKGVTIFNTDNAVACQTWAESR